MKIAVLGAVSGTTPDEYNIFNSYLKVLYKYFDEKDVFSPIALEKFLSDYKEQHKNASLTEVHTEMVKFDLKKVREADFVFVDVSLRSTGVGMELTLCSNKNVCLFSKEGTNYSNMVEGLLPDAPVVKYNDTADLERKLDGIVRKKVIELGTFKRDVKKAGCIVVNVENKKIGLIYRKTQNDYTFPKGHMENNETFTECAIRETAEETKRDVSLISKKPIASFNYFDGLADHSFVEYYIGVDIGPSDNTSTDTHELVWTDVDEVESLLSYDSIKDVWRIALPTVNKLLNKKR